MRPRPFVIAWPLLCAFLLSGPARARDLSIEEALQLGQTHSEEVQVAQAALDRAGGDRVVARAGYLPQVGFATNYQHTFLSEYDDLFGDSAASFGSGLPFGADDTWRLDFSLSQTVFGGGRVMAQNRMARTGQDLAWMGLVSTRAGVALQTAQAYFDAVLADRLVEIARDSVAQAELTLEHARLGQEVGRQPEFELLRARVALENQRVSLLQQERVQTLAHQQLHRLLGLQGQEAVALSTSLDEADAVPVAQVAGDAAGVAADTQGERSAVRSAVRQAEGGIQLQRSALALTRSQLLPQLQLSWAYGWVQYPDDPMPSFDPEDWRTNLSAGLTLSIPIFQGGRLWGEMARSRASLAEAEARLQQTMELAALDSLDASSALDNAQAQWTATAGTIEQAQRAYAIAEVRFKEGISTQLELSDARLLLQQALANRARAARDLQVARVRVALLPALALGAGAGPASY